MEKKRDSRGSSTCERILNAIKLSRVFRPIGSGSTGKPPKQPSSPPPLRTSGNPGMAVAGNGREKGVQNGNDDQVAMAKPAKIAPTTESERTKPEGDHAENQFSDYIERARAKLRTVSSIGSGGKKEKRDSTWKTDEHFTNFIDKAKARLRTTSSIGGGKGVTSYK